MPCLKMFPLDFHLATHSVPPQVSPFEFGEEAINSGDFTSVQCSVHKGDLPVNITWVQNGRPIKGNEGVTVSKTGKRVSTLTIDSVDESHSGNYTCVVQNKAGSVSFTAELHVNGEFMLLLLLFCFI